MDSFLSRHWNANRKPGSLTLFRLEVQPATEGFHNILAHGKANSHPRSRASGLRRVERLKDTLTDIDRGIPFPWSETSMRSSPSVADAVMPTGSPSADASMALTTMLYRV